LTGAAANPSGGSQPESEDHVKIIDRRHQRRISVASSCGWCIVAAGLAGCASETGPSNRNPMTFFVTSTTSATGNLGGLRGADATCQQLAAAAGAGDLTWRAYLSAERDPDNNNNPTDARTRIGNGPWVNVNGATIGTSSSDLHSRSGNAELFVDERGTRINGQWGGSPTPVQHDILTGSNPDGTLMAGFTCADWTSASASIAAQVGHSDGLGPGGSSAGSLASWNSAHASASCADTAPRGGAGRFYCFVRF
jgi:hypothetical protein